MITHNIKHAEIVRG